MYKFFLPVIPLLGICILANAQPVSVPLGISARDKVMQNSVTNWSPQITITDVNGRPVENRYEGVNGIPYFTADYKYSIVTMQQGRKFSGVKTLLNLVTQELVFVSANGQIASIEPGTVKEISFADTTAQGIIPYLFQTGFPAVDKQTDKNFYQVLIQGKCRLLRSMVKKITERNNELSGEQSKEFETIANDYLFINGQMKRCRKDKDFVLGILADKQVLLNQFIADNKINCKKEDQLIRLLTYYNSL